MTRSLQLSILTWLAALAAIGAIHRPTGDTILFAIAFVLGTALLRLRDWMHAPDAEPRSSLPGWEHVNAQPDASTTRGGRVLGELLAVSLAWGLAFVRARRPEATFLPPKLDAITLMTAATVPSVWLFFRTLGVVRAWRARREIE